MPRQCTSFGARLLVRMGNECSYMQLAASWKLKTIGLRAAAEAGEQSDATKGAEQGR